MWKQNKFKIILSSIFTLLPILFGIIVWDSLPEQMSIHWGIDGNVDGTAASYVAVFVLPSILCLANLFCLWITSLDKKNADQNPKAFRIVYWIMPMISFFSNGIFYAVAFGKELKPALLLPITIGGLFALIGNYLPKCKQNYTLGIKIKWTLENEENWNMTHRFGGKMWFFGGLCILFCMFLSEKIMFPIVFAIMIFITFVPVLYSYLYYRKQKNNGTYKKGALTDPLGKKGKIVTTIAVPAILVFVAILMFTGTITISYSESSFTVDSTYYSPLTLDYDAIDSIELRENFDFGSRTYGFHSAKMLLGNFRNEELGNYVLYSYTKSDSVVIIKSNKKTLVIGGINKEATKEIYETLSEK